MRLHRGRFVGTLALVLTAAATAGKPTGHYGRFSIAEEPTTPRISAMGSAGTALVGGGFGCYNPASPAFAAAPYLTLEYGKVPGDLSKSLIETAWMFSRWFAGASLRFHSTDWQTATEQGTGAMSSDQAMQAVATGGFTWGRFASGHGFSFLHERIGDQSVRAFTYSAGIMFLLVPDKVTLGASMLHYLRLDTLGSPKYKTPLAWRYGAIGLPRYVRAGAAWNDTVPRAALPFTIAADVIYSDVYDCLMAPLGAEVWILPYLAARAGTWIHHPAELAHFGVGLRWSSVAFDFDYGITKLLKSADPEPKWLMGLTYTLPSRFGRKTAAPEGAPRRDPAVQRPPPAAPGTVPAAQETPATATPLKKAVDSLPPPGPVTPSDSLRQPAVPDTVVPTPFDTVSSHADSTQSSRMPLPANAGDSTAVEQRIAPPLPERRDSIPAVPTPLKRDMVPAP